MDVRLRCPFTCLVVGATMTGKTRFVCDLLDKPEIFDTEFSDITVCHSEWQPAYDRLKEKGVRFNQGLMDPDELDPHFPHLVILDDLMDTQDRRIEQFFTRTCHHRNTSCIYIVQNMFSQGRGHRTCSLNTQYLVLFKSPRDVSQIRVLEQQMFPGKKHYLVDSYHDACEKPFHYLFVDLKPDTPSHLRIRGRILNFENQDVYLPKQFQFSYQN